MTTAKLFWTGDSQAVKLPDDYRFIGSVVNIRKRGEQVIIEPLHTDWDWLDNLDGDEDPSWGEAIDQLKADAEVQDRDWSVFE